MEKKYEVPLREAVEILGKKPATVRAYVRSGRLSKQYVDGFNGQEMRLNKEELLELKEALKDSSKLSQEGVSNKGTTNPIKNTPLDRVHQNTIVQGAADPNLARAIELLEHEISELRKEKESLRTGEKEMTEKNFQMAGQLGYYQNQVETLKDQVKQLSAPAHATKPPEAPRKGGLWGLFGAKK